MTSTPTVSVVMPVYNAGPFLEQAVASVFAQTLTDWELIAVDDASTDGSWDYLRRIDDPRVRIARNSANLKHGATLNRAIDLRRKRQPTVDAASALNDDGSFTSGREVSTEPIDLEALRNDIVMALDGLSEMQRAVVVAKVYDELTFVRIADELSLAVSTVKTHYLRAVRYVRDRLQPRWASENQL